MYTIDEMAGVAESTVCLIVKEVSEAFAKTLWKEAVDKHFPNTKEDFKKLLLNINKEWQFLYDFRYIHGSHLPIKCLNSGAEAMKEYYNFKNFYSVVL